MSENVTRLVIVVEWNGGDEPYYLPEERIHLLKDWITKSLIDRNDHPEIVSLGEITR